MICVISLQIRCTWELWGTEPLNTSGDAGYKMPSLPLRYLLKVTPLSVKKVREVKKEAGGRKEESRAKESES